MERTFLAGFLIHFSPRPVVLSSSVVRQCPYLYPSSRPPSSPHDSSIVDSILPTPRSPPKEKLVSSPDFREREYMVVGIESPNPTFRSLPPHLKRNTYFIYPPRLRFSLDSAVEKLEPVAWWKLYKMNFEFQSAGTSSYVSCLALSDLS